MRRRDLLGAVASLLLMAGPVQAQARPVVAILADPKGTETTDMIAPYAILRESGAVEVEIVAATLAPIALMPGMGWVKPQATRAGFDRAHPGGADMVIVPYQMKITDPVQAAWLRAQAKRGARIVSICAGAEALAYAGLLDGRQATTHWASVDKLAKKYPKVTWRRDARWVTDGKMTTSAGVTASIPTALYLLKELAGEGVMRATAQRLGLEGPSPVHNGAAFKLDGGIYGLAAGNAASLWRHETVAIPLAEGFDDLAFAAQIDGWSRTYRSKAWVTAPAGGVTSRHGLTVFPARGTRSYDRTLKAVSGEPEQATLAEIRAAYGADTARFVALQLEHPEGVRR